ncbi:MAG: hypothetical protein V1779_10080 [bacterium]
MKKLTIMFVILTGVFLVSCTGVYSPSINLPDKITKNETKIFAAFEILPSLANRTDEGLVLAVQHSFSNNVAVQLKYWSDINSYDTEDGYLHGFSLISYILLSDTNSNFRFYAVPTIGMSLVGNEIELGTIGSWIAVQTPNLYFFKPYFSIGFLAGSTDLNSSDSWGFAIMTNVGTNIQLYDKLMLNFEMSFPLKYDFYWEDLVLFYTPTIGISYKF